MFFSPVQKGSYGVFGKNLLFIGELTSNKNIAKLIDIVKSNSDWHLTVAGFGRLKRLVQKKCKESANCNFVGHIESIDQIMTIIDQSDIDIDIGIYGFIPEEIIPQAELRLSIYKEISSIKENKNLEQNKKDFIDRFGDVTSEITNLYELSKLKNIARKLNILGIKYRDENFSLKLADDSRLISPSSQIRDIKISAKDIKSDRLTFIMSKLESFLDKNEK